MREGKEMVRTSNFPLLWESVAFYPDLTTS
jgi:hypothetical protein